MVVVRDTDKGFKRLLVAMRKIAANSDREITVGVHSDEGASYEGLTVQDIATIHEFGTATIPSRSFIRAWFDSTESENIAKLKRALETGLKKGNLDTPLKQLASVFVADIQARMIGGIPPPLQSRDGTPLIDTGQLKGSINAKLDGSKI